jgi:heme/copper-type cytochrome/quinol oxidase subunit 2
VINLKFVGSMSFNSGMLFVGAPAEKVADELISGLTAFLLILAVLLGYIFYWYTGFLWRY